MPSMQTVSPMKRYKASYHAVVKLTYICNAKSEEGAVRSLNKHREKLEEMQIDLIAPLEELGCQIKEIKPRKKKTK
jgi:hypothetical protein